MRFFKDTRGIRNRKNRPKGILPEKNLLAQMLNNVDQYLDSLKKYPEIEAVTLTGGLSRGYSDSLSEIDLNIYLIEEKHADWTMGKGPIPQGDHKGTKYHMDVSFLNLQQEQKEKWSLLKKWDASYTKILYDPSGKAKTLLESKDVFTANEKYQLALRNYLDCVYFGDIVVRQWILREDPLTANQMITKGIHALCNLLFLANDEYPPFEKWLINYSHSLSWKPKQWREKLEEITLVKEITSDEVKRRSIIFMELYHEIWGKLVGVEHSETGLLELEALVTLEYVIYNQPTVEEFINKHEVKQLGYEVLYKLTDIKKQGEKEVIVFNKEKYLEEKTKGFPSFLEWNKKMLCHIKLSRS